MLSGSTFQWADIQLPQGWNLASCSAIAVNIISRPRDYVAAEGQMVTNWARVQFTIFGYGNDSTNADAVAAALLAFLFSLNLSQASGTSPGYVPPTYVLNDRDSGFAQTDPLTYMRIIDARIFVNDTF